jgi:hypothetical protein
LTSPWPPAARALAGGDREVPTALDCVYDVEGLVDRAAVDADVLRGRLTAIGQSVIVAQAGDALKFHVHVDRLEVLWPVVSQSGRLVQMEIWNMQKQIEAAAPSPPRGLAVVVPRIWHPLFEASARVLDPEEGEDRPDTLWLDPPRALQEALAVDSPAVLDDLVWHYDPTLPWADNRERLLGHLAALQRVTVTREVERYYVHQWGQWYSNRHELAAAVLEGKQPTALVTVYLNQRARAEEAAFWQETLDAELVQVPDDGWWMEILLQP